MHKSMFISLLQLYYNKWLQNEIHFSLFSAYMCPCKRLKPLHWFPLVRQVLWWPIMARCPSKCVSAAGVSAQGTLVDYLFFLFFHFQLFLSFCI